MKHMIDASSCTVSRRDLLRLTSLAGIGALAPGFLMGCGSASSFSYEATIADARTAIRKAMADTNTPSLSVALIDKDRVIWAEAFGVIDKTSGRTPTTDTLYCIGSCSKMIATIAAMILVERAQVDLDAPLVRYLPEFTMASPEFTRVTVRMLLSHSSGFPGSDYRGIFSLTPNPNYAVQVMQTLATVRLKHAPGEMSVYCNDGFTMIELLVRSLTGSTYPQFVTQEIFAPLGMVRSRFALEPFADASFAPGFSGENKLPLEFVLAYASGGLYTTPSEMGRLARMLLNGGQLDGTRILQPASVTAMARDQTLTQPLRPVIMQDGYGLGWDGIRQEGLAAVGVTVWHKNGGTSIYGSDFFVAPDEGLALMITGTTTSYGSGALAERILLNALLERRRIAAMPSQLPSIPGPEAVATDALLADVAGLYAYYNGLVRVQVQADRTLSVSKYSESGWAPSSAGLKLRSDGSFSSDASPNVSYQGVIAQGERYLVMRIPYGMGHYLWELPYAQKITPKAALSATWLARLDRQWLAVNEPADSLGLAGGSPVFTLAAAPDLPGYVLASAGPIDKHNQIADASSSDSTAQMCLKIPFAQGRDLDDVRIESRFGEEWVQVGSSVFRPARSVPALGVGASVVPIGADGFAEWRTVTAGAAPVNVSLSGVHAWRCYGPDFKLLASGAATGQLTLPAGAGLGYLMLFGTANASVGVTVS